MTFLYTMLFFLFGNSKEIFFENINVGDDLETCLANGSVQYKNNGISLELPSSNIATNYFTYNVVKFDQDNIIKEIKLLENHSDRLSVFIYINLHIGKVLALKEDRTRGGILHTV